MQSARYAPRTQCCQGLSASVSGALKLSTGVYEPLHLLRQQPPATSDHPRLTSSPRHPLSSVRQEGCRLRGVRSPRPIHLLRTNSERGPFPFQEKRTFLFQTCILGLGSLLYLGWSFSLPLALRQAMRASRTSAVIQYTGHLEEAFGSFLESPTEESLNRFEWLQRQQKVVRGIARWPLTLVQTLLIIVVSNGILLGVSAWYVGFRLGYWAPGLGLW